LATSGNILAAYRQPNGSERATVGGAFGCIWQQVGEVLAAFGNIILGLAWPGLVWAERGPAAHRVRIMQ